MTIRKSDKLQVSLFVLSSNQSQNVQEIKERCFQRLNTERQNLIRKRRQ